MNGLNLLQILACIAPFVIVFAMTKDDDDDQGGGTLSPAYYPTQ